LQQEQRRNISQDEKKKIRRLHKNQSIRISATMYPWEKFQGREQTSSTVLEQINVSYLICGLLSA
jgi:hypothetical protein